MKGKRDALDAPPTYLAIRSRGSWNQVFEITEEKLVEAGGIESGRSSDPISPKLSNFNDIDILAPISLWLCPLDRHVTARLG
jgi:hypothetical protein